MGMRECRKRNLRIGHRVRLGRGSATASLRTGADMGKTGAGAGSSAGAGTAPNRRRSNHERTDLANEARWSARAWQQNRWHPADGSPARAGSHRCRYTPATRHTAHRTQQIGNHTTAAACCENLGWADPLIPKSGTHMMYSATHSAGIRSFQEYAGVPSSPTLGMLQDRHVRS